MPAVVRSLGDLKKTKNVDGQEVRRQGYLFYHDQNIPCLNSDNHFLYKSKRIGSAILCTCGGGGVSVGPHAYMKYTSQYLGNEVLVCHRFFSEGRHADGSS